jgi:ubiquinone/menaquinone biosynthesis C-methylase UbiE
MEPVIKIDISSLIDNNVPIVLELGCGRSRTSGRIGIDRIDSIFVDIVADVEEGLLFLPDNSVDEIHSKSFFEHVNDLEGLMREVVRVLKKEGRCYIFVPHFSNPYYYSDYTHTKFMGLYTFYYFVDENFQLSRKVPNFYTNTRIRVVSQKLVIANPFKKGAWFKKGLDRFFNRSTARQEFYEENLCWMIPCYGLELVITPEK